MTNFIQVRVRKDTKSPPEHEALIRYLFEEEEPPFALPSFIPWPRGERRMTDRALMLMHAGIEHLRAGYPKQSAPREVGGAVAKTADPGRAKEEPVPDAWKF